MPRSKQVKELEKMNKIYLESKQWMNREQALLPLQNIVQGKPGDRVLYQSLVVRYRDIWLSTANDKLKAGEYQGPQGRKNLEAEIKHYQAEKEQALMKLGEIVYEPVIEKINEQEKQERQQRQQQGQQQQQQEEDGDGDVIMSGTVSIGGKKRRKSKGRKRSRKGRKSRRKSRRKKRRRKKRTKRRR